MSEGILREFVSVIDFTSFTPENSWGINCVCAILEGPMVLLVLERESSKSPRRLLNGAFGPSRIVFIVA